MTYDEELQEMSFTEDYKERSAADSSDSDTELAAKAVTVALTLQLVKKEMNEAIRAFNLVDARVAAETTRYWTTRIDERINHILRKRKG